MSDNTNDLLYPEIYTILNNKATKPRKKEIKLIIHTIKHDLYVYPFVSLEILQDFINNISDYILVAFKIPLGDFVKVLYPYKDNLEMTIYNDGVTRRYKLLLHTDIANISIYSHTTQEDLNKMEMIHVEGQCLDRTIELLRVKSDTGIYRDVTVTDVIRHIVLDGIKDIKIDGKRVECKLTMEKANNSRKYKHITIPNGTKVIDIPNYLQNTDYGVYNGDIGIYYQQLFKKKIYGTAEGVEPHMFVYPLTNTDVSKKKLRKLEIYKLPHSMLHTIDNSFVVDDKSIKIVIDVASDDIDTGDKEYINYGEAFSTIEVNKVLNRPHIAKKGETPEIRYKDHTYNMAIKTRDDKTFLSRTIKPTDNLYRERSKVLKTLGSVLKFTWRSADIEYLYPAMAVTYTYVDSFNNVIQYDGVLQHVFNKIDDNFESIAILTVYMNKQK